MRDVRGNTLEDGDLALKVVNKETTNELVYCVIVNNKPFYSIRDNYSNTETLCTYNHTQSNQIVKIVKPRPEEVNIRLKILKALAEYTGSKSGIGKESIKKAKELLENYRGAIFRHDRLPELGIPVEIFLKDGNKHKAILTETTFYPEGKIFEDKDTLDHRVKDVEFWKYL